MKARRIPLIGAAVAAALATGAGDAVAGDLAGHVTSSSTGQPLPNATVRIPSLNRAVTSDRSGNFRFNDLPAGSYEVEVSYVGFEGARQQIAVPESGLAQLTFELGAAELAEVMVTGYRLAQATALQDKKSAAVIKDSVTADDAGKLPDRNAAEALSRVSGISVTVDEGEGRYVTVRGIDPSLNTITIDNQVIGTPEGDTRRVALDTIPSDLLSKLEVVKSVTPDMDGSSIGGAINVITPSAFDDRDGHFLKASADVGYYDMNGKSPYSGSLAWGQTFGPERQWGLVLSGSYSRRNYESQNVQGGDPWEEEGDFLVPDEYVLREYELTRVRKGIVANLEWLPAERTKLYFRNLFNEFQDEEIRAQTIYDYRGGDLLDQTPTSGTFTEGEGERHIKDRLEKQSIQQSTLGGEIGFGDWTLGLSASYGTAKQKTPFDYAWAFELDEEVPMTYDTSSRFFRVDAGPDFHDASRYEFDELEHSHQIVDEIVRIGQVDLKRAFDTGAHRGFFKFGGKVVNRDKKSDMTSFYWDGFDGDFTLADVAEPHDSSIRMGGRNLRFGPRVDFDAAEAFFAAHQGAFELNDTDTISESATADYRISEDVTAGYIMGSIDIGRVTVVGGVRVEHTKSDFSAYDIEFEDGDIAGTPTPTSGSKNYTNWMPGLQARFAARENVILRAAWTNTIARPSYEKTVPFRNFEVDPDGPTAFEGELSMGNPTLDPLESMNFDLSFEWYLEPAGMLSVGLFYKDIDRPIYTLVRELNDTEFDGRFYSQLFIEQPQNAKKGEILGIELSVQQQFRSLPSPFDGFGFAIGYTYSDSEAEVFNRPKKTPFFLQSKHVGNASIFYEKAGFEARLAYAYRSPYLEELGDGPAQDLYIDKHGQLDFKASYQFTNNTTAFIEMKNITDEPVRFYSGTPRRLAENERYSWNAVMGVQLKF